MKIGDNAHIDLDSLIATRLLIQANSGGGKSWLLRKILEESHGKVQQIVIDLEGEFLTLREEFDYLLAGKGGDIPVNIKTADLLARKLLELNVSTIIDISEMKKHERILFVKRFLDSLVDAPKALWHSCIVVVDEAHQFCPQASKSESAGSVIDLMTRGRKRGFCGILATQRISKLHKDACAEANNRLIGRTGLDVDRKRASEELGFTSKEDERSLRYLDPGEFYAFGPAISKEIRKIKVGNVKTTHPEPGRIIQQPVPPSDNIKNLLKKIIDLPKEAEEELKTKQDMQKRISDLKREVRILEHSKPEPEADQRALDISREQGFKEAKVAMMTEAKFLRTENDNLIGLMGKIGNLLKIKPVPRPEFKPIEIHVTNYNPPKSVKFDIEKQEVVINDNPKPKAGAMRMLAWLAGAYPDYLSKQRLGTLSGFSATSGTFGEYISKLKKIGWVEVADGKIRITDEGNSNTESNDIPSGSELIEMWASKFKRGIGKMLKIICDRYPGSMTRMDLGYESGFSHTSGTFGEYLSKLRKNGLIKVEGEYVTASSEFFE